MNEFIIVSFLTERIPDSFERTTWPFHTTILAPFTTDLPPLEVQNILQQAAKEIPPFSTKGKSRELFGRDNTVSVTELYKTPELARLHMALFEAFSDHAAFKSPDWVGENYRPHVTDTQNRQLRVMEEAIIQAISLVELEHTQGLVLYTCELAKPA